MHRDYPRFTAAQVAEAANIPVETLRTWLKKGAIALIHDESEVIPDIAAPGTGRGRLFTLSRSLNVAIAAELNRIGIPVKTASLAALHFSDLGEVVAGWGNDIPKPRRMPGELFPGGQTALVLRFINDEPDVDVVPLASLDRYNLHMSGSQQAETVVVLILDNLVRRVRATLGVVG